MKWILYVTGKDGVNRESDIYTNKTEMLKRVAYLLNLNTNIGVVIRRYNK